MKYITYSDNMKCCINFLNLKNYFFYLLIRYLSNGTLLAKSERHLSDQLVYDKNLHHNNNK